MKKHYFLGTAAGYTREERLAQRHTLGSERDLTALRKFLLKEYGGNQVIITQNGRSAIAGGLKCLASQLGEPATKTGVIVNGFTCHAVVQGVKGVGMEPIYADIDPKTLNFTLGTLEEAVTDDCWAIIVQNTLGNMIDMKAIEKFARKHKLVIIEDLAHCTGRFYPDGREAGKVGQAVAFSFGKEKSIDVVNGGAVVFRDHSVTSVPEPSEAPGRTVIRQARWYPTWGMIYRRLSYIGLHGVLMRFLLKLGFVTRSADGEVDYENVTLSGFQAKLALERLRNKGELHHRPLREFYLVRDREQVLKELERAGYYFRGFWYEKPISPERYYKEAHFPEKKCPNAVWVAKHIVNLPNYYTDEELAGARKIVEAHREESVHE